MAFSLPILYLAALMPRQGAQMTADTTLPHADDKSSRYYA